MHTPRRVTRVAQPALAVLLLSIMVLMSACGGNAQTQQQASQNKTQLDHLLQHAQVIGVPMSVLKPILKQEQQLDSSSAPFNPFNDKPVNDYYHNLADSYSHLIVQTQGLVTTTTEQAQAQAQHDMQNFQTILTQLRSQNLPVQNFTQQFSQDQAQLTSAKFPNDYTSISNKAHVSTQALDLMQTASGQLTLLNKTIGQMQQAHIDVTAMQTQYQDDLQTLASGMLPLDFQNLSALIDVQYQHAIVSTTQALPYVTTAKLSEFENQVKLL